MPKDYVQAHMWFNLAAAQGDEGVAKRATKLRDLLDKEITRQQLAEAQRLAREWKPQAAPAAVEAVYKFPADGFEVWLPVKPLEARIRIERGKGHGYGNVYQAEIVNPLSRYTVFVAHSVKKSFEKASVEASLDGWVRGELLAYDNAVLKYARSTRFLEWPALEFVIGHTLEGVPAFARGIGFIVDGDNIQLSQLYLEGDSTAEENYRRFVSSFRLTPIDAPLRKQRFKDEKHSISLLPPEDWEEDISKDPVKLIFSNAAGHSISLVTSSVPSYTCEHYKYELKSTVGIQASDVTTVNGRSAMWLKSTVVHPTEKVRITTITYCLNTSFGAVVVVGAAPKETFFRSERIFQKVVSSLVIEK